MFVLDILFPVRCLGCGYLGVYICPCCEKKLHTVNTQACIYCKKSSLYGLTHPICKRRGGVDGHITLFYYDNTLKKIIKGIKYSLTTDAWADMLHIITKQGRYELLFYKNIARLRAQPIPLSEGKEKKRGFNQAKIITNTLSLLLQIKTTSLLKRKQDSPPQAQIKRENRFKNIKGAFYIDKGKKAHDNILIVDDVVTSGATVKEAAGVLKRAGAKKVYVFSIAKG